MRRAITITLALAALSFGAPALAQNCEGIDFAPRVLQQFPEAPFFCQEIVEKNGEMFARFDTEFRGTTRNGVRARFRSADGRLSDTYEFDADLNNRVHVGQQAIRYRDLPRGQRMNIYLPSDRWEFHVPEEEAFVVTTVVLIAIPREVEEEPSSTGGMLPSTASPLPLIGLAGGLFMLLGFGLRKLRRS